jgi:hypothetical protein
MCVLAATFVKKNASTCFFAKYRLTFFNNNVRMRFVLLLFLFAFFTLITNAQTATLKGTVLNNADRTPVAGATVQLISQTDSSKLPLLITDSNGRFAFNGLLKNTYTVIITYVGYNKIQQAVVINNSDIDLGALSMVKAQGKELEDVVVIAKTPPVEQKADTIQYNANQYKTNPDATTEQLIAKMPGITVDNTGTVTAHGDQVKSVTVDGKKFFGDDVTTALRNLPAEVVDKIQVFDKLTDQAAFAGFDDGNSVRAINIVTKASMRNGSFGRLFAGYGTDDRYYAGGNVNFFHGDRRLSFVGLFNNVNQQNFSSQDLLGFSNNNKSGGRGGGSTGGFSVGPQSGINTTDAFGINYSDMWGKKLEVQSSYFFNYGSVNNNQISNIQTQLTADSTQYENQTTNSNAKNYNNRINLRFDYKFDSSNLLTITPVLSFQKNNSFTNIDGIYYSKMVDSPNNSIISNANANASGYNISNSILYRHAFAKKGRTVSLNLTTGFTKNDGDSYLQSITTSYPASINPISDSINRFTDNKINGYQLSSNIAYTEPIGKKSQLQLNYLSSYSRNTANTGVYEYNNLFDKYSDFDTSLSNQFNNTVTVQNAGITYRIGNRDNMFAAGASYQYTLLNSIKIFPFSSTIHESFNNVLPNLMWRKKLSTKANLRILYRASTLAPSVNQLQNIINNTNPLFVTEGNPALKQQTGNTISARYTFTNTEKSNSFFANVYAQQYNNYIGNATFIAAQDSIFANDTLYKKGAQITRPVNLDGYLSLRSFFTYGFPVELIKSNVNFNAGFTWVRNPVLIQNVSSITNNYGYNTGVVVASNISQYVDFTLSYSASFNVVKNTNEPQLNNNYFTQAAGIKFNLLDKKGWFVNNDLSNQSYSGLTNGFNQNYWLWNVAIGKKFLQDQRSELKVSGFDLLKQNRSIARTVTSNYIEDDQNLVLTQYFMLTFTYKLKTFGTLPNPQRGNGNNGRMRGQGNVPSF